jgi:hypothetical protein
LDRFDRDVVPDDFTVDILFANAASNQLRELGSEIEHEHPFAVKAIGLRGGAQFVGQDIHGFP